MNEKYLRLMCKRLDDKANQEAQLLLQVANGLNGEAKAKYFQKINAVCRRTLDSSSFILENVRGLRANLQIFEQTGHKRSVFESCLKQFTTICFIMHAELCCSLHQQERAVGLEIWTHPQIVDEIIKSERPSPSPLVTKMLIFLELHSFLDDMNKIWHSYLRRRYPQALKTIGNGFNLESSLEASEFISDHPKEFFDKRPRRTRPEISSRKPVHPAVNTSRTSKISESLEKQTKPDSQRRGFKPPTDHKMTQTVMPSRPDDNNFENKMRLAISSLDDMKI